MYQIVDLGPWDLVDPVPIWTHWGAKLRTGSNASNGYTATRDVCCASPTIIVFIYNSYIIHLEHVGLSKIRRFPGDPPPGGLSDSISLAILDPPPLPEKITWPNSGVNEEINKLENR
jgi:hypothetical protein